MAIQTYRLGADREPGEGLRLGVVRRPPRGVKKENFARGDYFDAWYPELAPSAGLLKFYYDEPLTDARWARYVKIYRREMAAPERLRTIGVLAQLSRQADFSIGCYCEREDRCHRSVLRDLLVAQGGTIAEGR